MIESDRMLKLWRWIGEFHSLLVVSFLIVTVLLVFFQVLLRYIFNAPLMGIEEFLLLPVAWLYMLGAAYASYMRGHIDCGIVMLYVKKPMTYKLLKLFRSMLVLIVCVWLLRWSWWYLKYAVKTDKESPLGYVRMLYVDSSVFCGMALMTTYSFVEFVDWFLIAIGRKKPVLPKEMEGKGDAG